MGKASRKKQLQKNLKPYNHVKLSQAILDICEPFNPQELALAEFEKLVTLAVSAWNIANKPEEEQYSFLLDAIQDICPDRDLEKDLEHVRNHNYREDEHSDATIMFHILTEMIRSKQQLYPNDDRLIINFDVNSRAGSHFVRVASMIPDKPR